MGIMEEYISVPRKENILKRAFDEHTRRELEEFDKIIAETGLDNIIFSDNFKQRMNALFRGLGFDHVPHPEVEGGIQES